MTFCDGYLAIKISYRCNTKTNTYKFLGWLRIVREYRKGRLQFASPPYPPLHLRKLPFDLLIILKSQLAPMRPPLPLLPGAPVPPSVFSYPCPPLTPPHFLLSAVSYTHFCCTPWGWQVQVCCSSKPGPLLQAISSSPAESSHSRNLRLLRVQQRNGKTISSPLQASPQHTSD